MIKKLQDEYSPKGQTLFAIFGWKIGDLEDAFKMPKHEEGCSRAGCFLQSHGSAPMHPP
ncbi:hypothetical protein LR48_Vigan07g118100 [Vigna angularis]|uniref:Uncharacterized protein n=1 Tax=Phaseolus angularis TaxID=3914 RepID=A0A0L9UY29_PHAAN|nr:hypothetical protein LR48_Vigan07g118100 [Vigna angularis]